MHLEYRIVNSVPEMANCGLPLEINASDLSSVCCCTESKSNLGTLIWSCSSSCFGNFVSEPLDLLDGVGLRDFASIM